MFLQFLVDILTIGSGSVDPHIFADPDPGSQNFVDSTDPDPKHWRKYIKFWISRVEKYEKLVFDVHFLMFSPRSSNHLIREGFNLIILCFVLL